MSGRASLTLHRRRSSTKNSACSGRRRRGVFKPPRKPKCDAKIHSQEACTAPSVALRALAETHSHSRRYPKSPARGSRGDSTPIPAASAANAGGFLQTSYPKRSRGLDPEPLLQLPVPPDLLQATVRVKAIKSGPGAPDDAPKCRVRQRYAPGRTSLSPRLGKSAKASLVDQSDMAATGGARRVQVQFRACRTSRESGSSGDTKVSSTW